ncbi:MAG: COR domain-containing protein [Methanocorpusculum sp.]|uniref:COR domain-containing protein n=1 Tax=Methanocorpusculum sp. TaxID=2058474 RepID=UPI00271DDA50|nr:COR domain-containing protein [Methanocorpusculum sp.]MDO9522118.1 COR domain-containing protein [Methanocorpusculum sp.]
MDEQRYIYNLAKILDIPIKEQPYNPSESPTAWLQALPTTINTLGFNKLGYEERADFSEYSTGCIIFSIRNEYIRCLAIYLPTEKHYNNFKNVIFPEINKISELTYLEILYFHSKAFNLPRSIENLSKLKCLDLWGRVQKTLEYGYFKNLSEVQYLYLYGNNLQTFQRTLENIVNNFPNITDLDLRNNHLSSIPESIGKLTKLRKLDLRENTLTCIPDSIGTLTQLKEIYLSKNQISRISPALGKLSELERLDLGGNNLSSQEIQGWIEQLVKLKNLDLRDNALDSIPESFGTLSQLKILNLSNNYGIKTIDDLKPIGEIQQLSQLFLNYTNIRKIPHSFIELNKLFTFQIYETPLLKLLPPEILCQSPKELIRYILDIQQDSKKLNESKLLIVGEGGVGKTCTLKMLTDDDYVFNPHEVSTEGIDIDKWVFTEDGNEYKLNIWDFGGQEIYHATHQFFLSRRSLYLLMWSARSDATAGRVDYWLKTITTLAGNSPIILVINQCDEGQRITPFNIAEYQAKYSQIKDYIKISCKDNISENRMALRECIRKEVKKLPLMEEKWSLKRYGVREELEKCVSSNYIPYEKYKEICQEKLLSDNIDIESLIKQLNDLGIVTYHSNDSELQGYVILAPEWITNAVYSIIDEQQKTLKDRNGILKISDLPKIWTDENQYPKYMYTFLLKMMESFDLVFHIVDNQYLIAELLEAEPLPSPWEFNSKSTRRFNYYYKDYLPAGIMTRFIVRINEFLYTDRHNKKSCWRYGAYLEHNDVQASVKLRETDKTLSIEVCGENGISRKDFLTIIRSHIDTINNDYSNLNVTRNVPCCCNSECKYEFDYDQLLERKQKGKPTAECGFSFDDVSINKLIDDIKDINDYYLNLFDILVRDVKADNDWSRSVRDLLYIEFSGVKKDDAWHFYVKRIIDTLVDQSLSNEDKYANITSITSHITSRETRPFDDPNNYFRWVHLSDIHIGYNEGGISCLDFRKALPNYLKDKLKDKQLDGLFITGDLRYAKTEDSPLEYTKEMVDFVKKLKEELNIADDCLFIVPGNHDLQRRDKDGSDKILKDRNKIIKKLKTTYWPSSGKINKEILEKLASNLNEYEQIYKDLTSREWEGAPKMGEIIKPHFVIPTPKTNILHLNTVLTISNIYETDLIVGRERLERACENIDTNKPTIVLAHYPFEDILESERRVIETDLRDKANTILYLCGHSHTTAHILIAATNESRPIHEFRCGTNMVSEGTPNWQPELVVYSGCMELSSKSGYVEAYKWVKNSNWVLDTTFSLPQKCAEDGRIYFPESARDEKEKFP